MTNFSFLQTKSEYALFSAACVDAEKVYAVSPELCAMGCRKGLELAIKWVYAADKTIKRPGRDNLRSLLHAKSFQDAVEAKTWSKLPYIVSCGNLSTHTDQTVSKSEALGSLENLFEFVQWIDYCYGSDYIERRFDPALIPGQAPVPPVEITPVSQRKEKAECRKVEAKSKLYTQNREQHKKQRTFTPGDPTEFQTRKRYIDVDLKELGWKFAGEYADVAEEYPVDDMDNVPGQPGFVDYVLFDKDHLPLAVVEAKRTSVDPLVGQRQGELYADCLERKFGRRPFIFLTNGFVTWLWDDLTSTKRPVSGIFSKSDLQKRMQHRSERKDLTTVPIDDKITDRYYQKEAIRAVCSDLQRGVRKHLLVMATGTGKTRTASSLTDVLTRGKCVTNILFLADRRALVKQAKLDFQKYLPNMSLCNLCFNKDDRQARIVFSTYPTMLNAIDSIRDEAENRLFSPGYFDLIIVDESHRSIFRKYAAIFQYFDAIQVGLTATPKAEVDRSTYQFFGKDNNIPTYAYDYDTAVYTDHVLVPYYTYAVKTKFQEENGIVYANLSEEDKARYEEDFTEDDGEMPEYIPDAALNEFIFNQSTVDMVLQELMEKGIKVEGGDRIGKTIIFAQNKHHAEFIVQRFDALYPQYRGKWARKIICEDRYAQSLIDDFKIADKEPYIAVSVDMMDTGVDVPECVNLVFFKKVRSKIKFWQMVGRGTRLCPELMCMDPLDGEYIGKRRFLIFDYCQNFEFFQQKPNGIEGNEPKTLTESIFAKQIRLIAALQHSDFGDDKYQTWREELIDTCHGQICKLNREQISVKLKWQYVQKYQKREAFTALSESDQRDLTEHIAPLVYLDDSDEMAKRFDNFMYGLMIAQIEGMPQVRSIRKKLCSTMDDLKKKSTIDAVRDKLPLIEQVQSEDFWNAGDLLAFEMARKELRELMRLLVEEGTERNIVFTNLTDPIVERLEGVQVASPDQFEDYKKKVNRYVETHGDVLSIYKLKHNIPLTATDYEELERILTCELGTKDDYQREYGDTPFGLLIRKIAKLDHASAMQAFSAFINDASLNHEQIVFVHKVIQYVEQNGYIENLADLQKPPFDKPMSFIRLFDPGRQNAIIQAIRAVKDNAEHIIA